MIPAKAQNAHFFGLLRQDRQGRKGAVGAAIVDSVMPQDDEVAKGEIGKETASV